MATVGTIKRLFTNMVAAHLYVYQCVIVNEVGRWWGCPCVQQLKPAHPCTQQHNHAQCFSHLPHIAIVIFVHCRTNNPVLHTYLARQLALPLLNLVNNGFAMPTLLCR